jgi:hypothetical protein
LDVVGVGQCLCEVERGTGSKVEGHPSASRHDVEPIRSYYRACGTSDRIDVYVGALTGSLRCRTEQPASTSPLLQFRRLDLVSCFFDHYPDSFEAVWKSAKRLQGSWNK